MAERNPCPQCGYENDAEQAFCGSCGASLVLTCGVCGATSPLAFKFCGACGADLRIGAEGPPAGEERRVVTVLFADLVGFTSRAEELDPEDVRAILHPYYASLRERIESFGGTVEKFIGDAVMGVFGAPVAHGDDPERAVRAALKIGDAVSEMNARDPRLDLQVRMAVNTGEAIVSLDARIEEAEYMIAGDVVNTASRLQTHAPTGSILVGEETYRCTRSVIEYEAVEPVVAKGKRLPVAAWRVVGAARPPGERGVSGVPMIGREHEMATLTGVWEGVVANRQPHLVTINGLPGIGKSRLASEFVAAVRESGARVVGGRALPYGESGAYDAFAQQVKQVAGVFAADAPDAAIEKLRRAVCDLLGAEGSEEHTVHLAMMLGLGTEATDAKNTDRHQLFFSARRFVEGLGDAGPTVLVFQDLHWADSSLLDLIELLAARVEKTPLLLLTLARPELHDKRAGWGSAVQASVTLPLKPLDQERSLELACALLGKMDGGQDDQTAEEIAGIGEGNPLFIEELVASVVERSTRASGEVPTSIRGIISARLDAIPGLERSMLLDASVIGKVFWNGALAHLEPYSDRLQELLDSLEGRDFIRREPMSRFRGQQQFRFKHTLIREVAYATLPRAKRKEAHAAVAAFLEEVHAERDSPAALGHHWREAGNREKAADYFVAAAEQANRGWAKEEAVGFYRQALALVRAEDQERYRKLRLKLAVAEQMLYHVPDAQRMAQSQQEQPLEQ
jgi:class 3 adenylate cyclase